MRCERLDGKITSAHHVCERVLNFPTLELPYCITRTRARTRTTAFDNKHYKRGGGEGERIKEAGSGRSPPEWRKSGGAFSPRAGTSSVALRFTARRFITTLRPLARRPNAPPPVAQTSCAPPVCVSTGAASTIVSRPPPAEACPASR
eukprot:scaffold2601_cov117-Isochrysis_galbana.AAC.3